MRRGGPLREKGVISDLEDGISRARLLRTVVLVRPTKT